ncbi:unnamed protein product [Auanema sp. JU1783]|nr:unnamed protein product [Auanema sp. JU1783]
MHQSTALEKPTAASTHTSIAQSASVPLPTMAMINDAISSPPAELSRASTSTNAIGMGLVPQNDISVPHFTTASSLLQQHNSPLNKRNFNIVKEISKEDINMSNNSQACNILQSILDTPMILHTAAFEGFNDSFQKSVVNQQVLKQATLETFNDETSVVHKDLLARNYMLSCMYSQTPHMLMTNIDQGKAHDNINPLNLIQSTLFNKPSTSEFEPSYGSQEEVANIPSVKLENSSTISRSISPVSSLSVSPENTFNSTALEQATREKEKTSAKDTETEVAEAENNTPTTESKKNAFAGEEEQDQDLDSILGFVSEKNVAKSTNSIFDFPGMDNGNDMQFTPPDSPEASIPSVENEVSQPKGDASEKSVSSLPTPAVPEPVASTIFPSSVPNILPFNALTPQMIEALRISQLHAANLAKGFNNIPSIMLHEQLFHHEQMLISAAAALAAAEAVSAVPSVLSNTSVALNNKQETKSIKEEVIDSPPTDVKTCISPMPKLDVKEIDELDDPINIVYGHDPDSPPPEKDLITLRPISKSTKVPIYKQNKTSAPTTPLAVTVDAFEQIENEEKELEDNEDEYKFEEDDEEIGFQEMKEKIQHEEVPKIARAVGAATDPNAPNCYIPGVGFAASSEKPENWRANKKKGLDGAKCTLGDTSHDDTESETSSIHSEMITIAETIRRRKQERFLSSFIHAESLSDTDCAKDVKIELKDDSTISNNLKVPKLIIRLPKKVLTECNQERKKKKKKRKRHYDEDSDWEEKNNLGHRIGRHSSRKSSSVDLMKRKKDNTQDDQECHLNSKKKRLTRHMMNDDPENSQFLDDNMLSLETIREMNENFFNQSKQKLNKFGSACGVLPKGTFVVNKTDLSRDDCALWKVDNQNLLQKFPPRIDPVTQNVHYKNSSTYSGWCEQISIGYYRVSVRILKQSRSEAIIEPEVPLAELFPALSNEMTDTNVTIEDSDPYDDEPVVSQQGLAESLCTFTLAMLEQAFTMEYFQSAKIKNGMYRFSEHLSYIYIFKTGVS